MKKKTVIYVSNKMQKKYSYEISARQGKDFDPTFKPDLTPREMLELGVFGGVYMRDCPSEYPKVWFKKAKFAPKIHKKSLASINFFGVNASQPLSVWREKGWIYKDDPRGWFEWYCRYYMGRRILKEDERQIKRWNAMKRHIAQVTGKCRKGDFSCNTRQRQALLHWAYDSRNF